MTSVTLASEVTHKAHDINRKRTHDVRIEECVDFTGLCLSPNVLSGLKAAGFVRPSPIQLKAIPLGRCGLDLIVQAKSGTGKTCVFTVIALENLIQKARGLQVLVLAPTREIAMQIAGVVKSIGSHMAGLSCHVFIGGLPVAEDKRKLQICQIAVGTPGRIKQLIEENVLSVDSIRLFILDEADKLLEDSFQDQINWIFSALPENKQILALSATYPEYLAQHLQAYMRNPTFVRLNVSDPALFGIRQYYEEVKFHPLPQVQFDEKVKHLTKLLSSVAFQQCLIFSNYQMRAQSLADALISKGWPAAYISGSQDQHDRISTMDKLKTMQCRILISTDLTSRGIDVEHVNLVINLDLPWDHETYLHRIGRAGRFGSYGAAVSYVAAGKEWNSLMAIAEKCNTTVKKLPDQPPEDLARSSGYTDLDNLVTVEKVVTQAGGDGTQLIPWPKTLKRDELNLELDTALSDGLKNAGLEGLELILQNESTTDSDITPTAFLEDMKNYSIHQEFGPEENGTPDWSGALQDVYSLVREIKDLYVSEKAAVKDVKPPKNGKYNVMKRAIVFDDVVQDYEKFVAEDKDDFEDWLEKFVPDRTDCHSPCLSENEVKDLIADINEQSGRLLSMEAEVVGETEFPEFNEEGHESSDRSVSEDNDSFPDKAVQHSKTRDDVLDLQKKSKKSPSLYNGRARMGIGSMLQHLRGGEELPSHVKGSVTTKDSCCSGVEQRATPAEYEDGLHDLSLPEVVDFSEYDQSYLYFENLDRQQGFSNDCYEAQDGRQDYESVPSPLMDEGHEYGEEMAIEGTVISDDQRKTPFRWVQDTQNDPERTESSEQSRSCRAKKEKRRQSGSSSSRGSRVRSSCDEQFSDCRSASLSSKDRRRKYSKGESLYPNPGSAYPSSKDKNRWYPWYPYVGYPPFPYMPPYGPIWSSAQYYAAAATVHDQWAKYYHNMCKAAHSNDSLSRIYKMQKDYLKSMSHRS